MDPYNNTNAAKRAKEEEKKVEPVKTTGVREKTSSQKVKNSIIKESASEVGSYILSDVLIPAAKKLVSDIVTNGINLFLYGDTKKSDRRSRAPSVSYRSYYDNDRDRDRDRDREYRSRRKSFMDYEITFQSDYHADKTLRLMKEALDKYGNVTVADMCEIAQEVDETVKLDSTWADDKYGWKSLSSARTVYSRGDWIIDLPPAKPID